jgi:hypothetical protein
VVDVGEGFGRESTARAVITTENGGFPGRGEGAVHGLRLDAELGGSVGQVGWRGSVCGREVDFGLAPPEGQLHFAGRSCCVLIDGVWM